MKRLSQHIADLAGISEDEAAEVLAAIEGQPSVTPEMVLCGFAEACGKFRGEREAMKDRSQEVGHRRYVRLPVAVPVVGRAAQFGDTEVHGTVWNIGGGGLMAKFPAQILPGSVVDLVLQTRTAPLTVAGEVVWAEPRGQQVGHGIAFREPKGADFAFSLFLSENE